MVSSEAKKMMFDPQKMSAGKSRKLGLRRLGQKYVADEHGNSSKIQPQKSIRVKRPGGVGND